MSNSPEMLLLEPATLLRRTVALTARSMGLANVHEAASHELALRLLKGQAFDGALIAVDDFHSESGSNAIALLDQVRSGSTASRPGIPIAVMIAQVDVSMLAALRARCVTHVLVKPYKARSLVDTFASFAKNDDRASAGAYSQTESPAGK